MTVGTSEDTYAFDGRSGDIDLLLWPVDFSLAYVGYTAPSPFVAYGVEAGLRYADASVVEDRLKRVEADLADAVGGLDRRAVIPFNRMAEWAANGRIVAEAAVYSPFVRHKQRLDLQLFLARSLLALARLLQRARPLLRSRQPAGVPRTGWPGLGDFCHDLRAARGAVRLARVAASLTAHLPTEAREQIQLAGATPPIILVIAAAASLTSGPIAASRCAVTRTVGPEIDTPPTGSPNSLKIAAATQRMPG